MKYDSDNKPFSIVWRPLCSRGLSARTGENIVGGAKQPRKSGKQIERCVIASFQIAESMGFKGDFQQWEELLRVGD